METPDTTFEKGLPANIDAERAILGGVLLENLLYHEAAEALEKEDFALDSHQRIFAVIGELMKATPPRAVDIFTLTEALSAKKELGSVGGVSYLASLTEGLPRRISIADYVRIVKDKSLLRQLIGICSNAITRAADQSDTAVEVLAAAEVALQSIGWKNGQQGLILVREYLKGRYATEESLFKHEKGIRTGLVAYDDLTGGLFSGEMTVIAARPSMGKTSWAMNVAECAAVRDKLKVAFFSLEESFDSLLHKMACSRARISFTEFRKDRLTPIDRRAVLDALDEIRDSELYIDESPGITISQMRSKASRLKHTKGLDLIVVDYLQLMTPDKSASTKSDNREQEVSRTSRGLKAMAKTLGVPVVALAQLRRTQTRPTLVDLRESGSIEQDADVVGFLYREEYYKPDDDELKGKGTVIVAKQRNGPIGDVHLGYSGTFQRWANPDRPGDMYYAGEF